MLGLVLWSKTYRPTSIFLKEFSCRQVTPCLRMSAHVPYSLSTGNCREIFIYFWSIWEQHVFSFIIVHLQTKIYEVLKRASVHLPVFIHYSTGTTTNSASLVLKRVRIRCARRCCCKVFSGRRVYLPLYSPIIRLELPPCR